MVAVTKLRVMLLQLPKWEVFFSIFLLGFKPLTKLVWQKAKTGKTGKLFRYLKRFTLITSHPSIVVCLN